MAGRGRWIGKKQKSQPAAFYPLSAILKGSVATATAEKKDPPHPVFAFEPSRLLGLGSASGLSNTKTY
jgi:hypothetical protein